MEEIRRKKTFSRVFYESYKKEFYIVPIVTPYALGYGVRCEITDKTKQSFKIRVLDSNNSDVGGNINWRARGY